MALTAKQEAFALAVFKGASATEAYRQCYDAGKMSPEAINVAASRLRAHAKVSLRIEELRAPAIEAAQLSEERTLKELAKLAYDESGEVAHGDKLRALDMAMKHQGLFEKDNAQQRESLVLKVEMAKPVSS